MSKAEIDAGVIATAHRGAMRRSWSRGSTGTWVFVIGYGMLSLVASILGVPWWGIILLVLACVTVYVFLERKVQLYYDALEVALLEETYKNLLEEK